MVTNNLVTVVLAVSTIPVSAGGKRRPPREIGKRGPAGQRAEGGPKAKPRGARSGLL
jgi:hypothetical protein